MRKRPGDSQPPGRSSQGCAAQVSETYHGPQVRLRVGPCERYHKDARIRITGLSNVTKLTSPDNAPEPRNHAGPGGPVGRPPVGDAPAGRTLSAEPARLAPSAGL